MNDLVFPIFVAEGLDISVFQSIEEAERSLEPWWIEENLGKVYDAQGRLITLKAGDKRVSIVACEIEPTHAEELKSLLREFLKLITNYKEVDPTWDLPCLVDECQKLISK